MFPLMKKHILYRQKIMNKQTLIKLFTNKETGKLNLPVGFVLGEPNKADETGIFQDKNNEWHVVKIGIPNPSGIGDAWYHRTLYCGYNEDNAFTVFFNFLIDKEDPTDWIINDKYEDDERIEKENKISTNDKVKVAFEKDEIKDLLLGKIGYYVPFDKYLGPAGPTDWTILMPSVYKYAKVHKDAQDKFEQTLFNLLRDNEDKIWTNSFEVYACIGIFYYQIFHEKHKQAGFDLKYKDDLIDLMQDILLKKYTQLSDSIFWPEIVRYRKLLSKECQIDLFAKLNKKLDKDAKQYIIKLNQFIKPLSAGLCDNVIHCHIDNEIEYTLDLCNKPYTYTEFERGSVRYTKYFNDFSLAKRWYALALRSSKSDDFLDELQARGDDFKAKLHNYYMALDDLKTYEDIFGEKFSFDDLLSYCDFNPDNIEKFEITAVTKLDPDSEKLGKQMKQEIEQALKEKNKPNLDKLALQKSGLSLLQYQFGKYRDPALVQPDDCAICIFKTDNTWFVEEVFSIYGDGTYTPLSGPFTYEQAKAYFLDYMLYDYPKLTTVWYELGYRRFDDFDELDKYLALNKSVRQSINAYLTNLCKLVKPNLNKLADFKVGATSMYFEMPKVINQRKYQIAYIFDYSKKPYTIKYEQYKIENNGFIYGKPVKQSSTTYTDLAQAEQAFKEKLISSLKDDKK